MEIVDKAIDLGTNYFKCENYGKAKEIFVKTIKLTRSYSDDDNIKLRHNVGAVVSYNDKSLTHHPRYIKLLDNLAACWEKLNDLKRALNYSDKMVQLEPYNLKCYIRRGKVLQKLGKDKEAYDNYRLGLRNAKEAYEKFNIDAPKKFIELVSAQKAKAKLRLQSQVPASKVSFEKRTIIDPLEEQARLASVKKPRSSVAAMHHIDFIGQLPLELLPKVLQGFSPGELITISFVNKTWFTRIFFFPQLFKDFKLDSKTYKHCNQFLQFVKKLSRSVNKRSFLTSVTIDSIRYSSKVPSEESKSLQLLLTNLQNYYVNRLILSIPNVTTQHLSKYILPQDNFITNVKELSLVTILRVDKLYEVNALSNFKNLHKLELIFETSMIPINSSVRVEDESDSITDPNWSKNLKSVKLICAQNKVKIFPLSPIFKSSSLIWDSLTDLYFSGITFDSESSTFEWLKRFQNLKILWFENNTNCKLESLLDILKSTVLFQNLQKLTFREVNNRTKFNFDAFRANPRNYERNFENLTYLDLMGTSLTGLGLTRLVNYLDANKFSSLNIGDCPYVILNRLPNEANDLTFSTAHFFSKFVNLRELKMHMLGTINDNSVNLLIEEVLSLQQLKLLDLSLNPLITGVSIYQLCSKLYEVRDSSPLATLVIDGCPSVSHITVNTIKSKGFVNKIDCVYEKEIWRSFGINSYRYP
ncbi:hypothetical protein KAFR_0D02340 [Kazachstania africana CBS 2517]|uniref:F-box domain-containing protein n=1 Tax=Kazachstania africana (strain ATCC 22294 / BCRC 22015 / CBS 2517 / CECT 1963 / NBRC 1671 / NRRL Y-8276) TaxID=1071382 RepID=H2AU31_KAZAF|nr:hypothetical protein KAFR_0D02340 [Kazachstania africana CBS 2517]CCF57881.1 hypothetical protein KAFR_0D02340 [Kazachstania africana CBS 2517]